MVNPHLWITTAAQMGMGFILPFALVFVAIPLETFVHSLRTVMGLMAIGTLRLFALLLRVLGNGSRHLGTLTQQLYDLLLFVPLWIETRMAVAAAAEAAEDAAEAAFTTVPPFAVENPFVPERTPFRAERRVPVEAD
jgi:hypothetical protein